MANLLHDFLLICVWLTAIATHIPFAKADCPTNCGNLTVPYPFGIGLDGACSRSEYYIVNCNTTFVPPKPFYRTGNLEIMEITIAGKMRLRSTLGWRCSRQGYVTNHTSWIQVGTSPVVLSDTDNKFIVVGCNTLALIKGTEGPSLTSGCVAMCSSKYDVIDGSCSGIGCCQTTIPKGLKSYQTFVGEMNPNYTDVYSFNPCSFAFLAEENKFNFSVQDLSDDNFYNATKQNVPVVLDWYIDDSPTCKEAQKNATGYACHANTNCTDFVSGSSRGYLCSCLPGYQGNPYLTPGCTDIDECESIKNNCTRFSLCINKSGTYTCSCLKGYHGDGWDIVTGGTGCTSNNSQFALKFSLGICFAFIALSILISLICFSVRKAKLMKQREQFFENNGGLLLKQQLSPYEGSMKKNEDSFKIYSSAELRAITNNYSDDRILGRGGYGIVHKGILEDGKEVAVKTSKLIDQTQIEQFINEVAILTQINHRNVVKLKGCCLETEVPILVYEYISNGTLHEHIHRAGDTHWLTWRNCIRLAAETADALAYLHYAASTPIIHRDIKSSNILIDDSFRAKVSDFGGSRLIPIDQTQVTTMVLGTHGYLDPEYLQTSQLTEKSDVYSFGVLLAELLPKQLPLSFERVPEDRNLATCFLRAIKEDRLSEIIDPELVSEASEEQLFEVGMLVESCLRVNGEDRPTMKEVAVKLEGLKDKKNHPWAAEQKYEESMSLLPQEDPYYPILSSDYDPSTGPISGQKDMLIQMTQPR